MAVIGAVMVASRIRVLIAEDHAVVREGTREILDRDPALEVVGEAEDGRAALALSDALHPDVVVLDLRLPLVSGIEVARTLRTREPSPAILVLSAYDDEDYVVAAMEAGVSGYLLKTAHGSEVISAIHAIVQGGVVLQPAIAAKLLQARRRADSGEVDLEPLTPREIEILSLAANGLRNKEIAGELDLSRRTVEGHFSHILAKLRVDSRSEAILVGASHGWFPLRTETRRRAGVSADGD